MVMPLWDDNPLKLPKWPVVTWGLIVLNIAVFLAQCMGDSNYLEFAFALTPVNIAAAPITLTPVHPYATLITYQFLHADIFHLLGNMLFLAIFGDDVEEAMGPLRFIGFYLVSGIAAGLAFTASTPHSTLPLIGASGAIAGILAAYLMFRPCQKVMVFIPYFIVWFVLRPITRLDAYWVLGAWALMQLWHISVQSQDEVAYMAHIGGFVAGAVMFPLLRYNTVRLFECIHTEPA